MDAHLRLDSVTLKLGGFTALSNLSWAMPDSQLKGGAHGIIGPEGAGKSTLFNLVTGYYRPTSGRIFFNGKAIHNLSTLEIFRHGIVRTFQNLPFLPHLSVVDHLKVAASIEGEGQYSRNLLTFSEGRQLAAEIRDRAQGVLKLVGLSSKQDKLPDVLSYGDRRKLEIAQALMRKPKLLLLDEPAAGMNASEKRSLDRVIRKIIAEKIRVLLIENDLKFVTSLCDQVTVMNQGSVWAQGAPNHIRNRFALEV